MVPVFFRCEWIASSFDASQVISGIPLALIANPLYTRQILYAATDGLLDCQFSFLALCPVLMAAVPDKCKGGSSQDAEGLLEATSGERDLLMAHKLKIKLTKHPDENSLLAACRVRPSRRLLKKVFGTAKPRHKMAILLPGDDADRVEVQVCETADESLMALAEAVGVAKGGEPK